MPAASEAVGAPGGVGDVEYEIRNDEGFVYKVPKGLYPDAAPSTTESVSGRPDPKAAGLRRRRRALLRLRDKRRRDLSRWEAVASELLLPLPTSQPPAPPQLPQPLPVAAASSSSASVIDELFVEVDIQTELMKKVNQWCDEANAICDAGGADILNSMVELRLLGRNPAELVAALSEETDHVDAAAGIEGGVAVAPQGQKGVDSMAELSLLGRNPADLLAALSEETEPGDAAAGIEGGAVVAPQGRKGVDSMAELSLLGRNPADLIAALSEGTEPGDAAAGIEGGAVVAPQGQNGVDSMAELSLLGHNPADLIAALSEETEPAADEMEKNGPVLTESRLRKRGRNLAGSVATPTSREKASGSISTAPATPGSVSRRKASGSIARGNPGSTTRRKATSTPARGPGIVCSPGPLTRRAAAHSSHLQTKMS